LAAGISSIDTLLQQVQPLKALADADRLAARFPDCAAVHGKRGRALAMLGRQDEAITALNHAVALTPQKPDDYYSLGNTFLELQLSKQALACYDQALKRGRDNAGTRNNRGIALFNLDRLDDALAEFDDVVARFPDNALAWLNRASILRDLLRLEEAEDALNRALALKPDYPEAQAKLAMLELLMGRYDTGLRRYETRWENTAFRNQRRDFSQPQWTGETSLDGKTLLIHAEQGFGDTVQFARYVPMAAAQAAHVVFEVQEELRPLLATLKGNITLVTAGQPLPPFDLHSPVMSLPLAFKTTLGSIPAAIPYLSAGAARVAAWREMLEDRRCLRVGLMWSGRPGPGAIGKRSIPLDLLAPLLSLPCEFHSLQKNISGGERLLSRQLPLHIHPAEMTGFADTAALIDLMDLVISVDTSVAHIAGALGKPLWLMLPWAADWRWQRQGTGTPWYPSATLFRQPARNDWHSPIANVAAQLGRLLGQDAGAEAIQPLTA